MLNFIDTDSAVIDAVSLSSSLCPFDISFGIDLTGSNQYVLICVVQIESDLRSVEGIINGDLLCDGDIAVLNVVLDDINESSIVIKCDFLREIRAVSASCPSGRSCIGILDRSISEDCLGDELPDLIRDFGFVSVINSKFQLIS